MVPCYSSASKLIHLSPDPNIHQPCWVGGHLEPCLLLRGVGGVPPWLPRARSGWGRKSQGAGLRTLWGTSPALSGGRIILQSPGHQSRKPNGLFPQAAHEPAPLQCLSPGPSSCDLELPTYGLGKHLAINTKAGAGVPQRAG